MFKSLVFILLCALFSHSAYAKLRMASYNIRNFDYDTRSNTPTNKRQLVNLIKNMQSDLLAVQEINDKHEFSRLIEQNFGTQLKVVLSNCGGSHDQRLGFIYNTEKLKLIEFKEDVRTSLQRHTQGCHRGSRPVAIARFQSKLNKSTIIAMAVHLKAGGGRKNISKRFRQLQIIESLVESYQEQGLNNIVIMGDFNSTEYESKGKNYRKFKEIVRKMQMKDSAEKVKCTSYWWGGRNDYTYYPSLLDHILVSHSLLEQKQMNVYSYGHCQKLKCTPTSEAEMGISFDEVSDHCPILTEIK
ncbi:MAG: endonuclease/exonuclease/phosphatase family protein [Bacteriovoracaceae bacterium]|jgi:endonuclease/exonuclease/phosphatase family metal-dependent hydrolase|nr:hypothetical protein [Halobacteriovoraceae bacterium]MDP7319230.1 endonuclease/exonuclease/phosphatase family protein [Bacteriovoracaceae bacterium]|tara:strand:- start:1403 stop:2302 length:900 start_codon:yes stop_codon:yes gene_type:complete